MTGELKKSAEEKGEVKRHGIPISCKNVINV